MKRRHFLGSSLSQVAPAPLLQAAPVKPSIKITGIKTFVVGIASRNLVFVKVETDQGIYGIGEAYSAGPDQATAW